MTNTEFDEKGLLSLFYDHFLRTVASKNKYFITLLATPSLSTAIFESNIGELRFVEGEISRIQVLNAELSLDKAEVVVKMRGSSKLMLESYDLDERI